MAGARGGVAGTGDTGPDGQSDTGHGEAGARRDSVVRSAMRENARSIICLLRLGSDVARWRSRLSVGAPVAPRVSLAVSKTLVSSTLSRGSQHGGRQGASGRVPCGALRHAPHATPPQPRNRRSTQRHVGTRGSVTSMLIVVCQSFWLPTVGQHAATLLLADARPAWLRLHLARRTPCITCTTQREDRAPPHKANLPLLSARTAPCLASSASYTRDL